MGGIRKVSVVVALVVGAAACSGSSSDTGPSSSPRPTAATTGVGSTTSPEPDTVETTVVPEAAELAAGFDPLGHDDGSWNLDAVLGVFATRHGDVPGVTPADASVAGAVDDQYLADILGKRLDELAPEQRAVVEAWLYPGPVESSQTFVLDGDSIVETTTGTPVPVVIPEGELPEEAEPLPTLAPDPTAGGSRGPRQGAVLAGYAADVLRYIDNYKRLSGVTFSAFEVVVEEAPLPRGVAATALPAGNACKVTVTTTPGGSNLQNVIAHEAYHCFQFAVRVPLGLHPYNEPRWVMEGTAAYAGVAQVTDVPWSNGWLALWHERPDRPLARRDYDALGLYETIEDVGAPDVWRLMVDLLRTDTPDVPLKAAIDTPVYGHWGAQYHQSTALGQWFNLRAHLSGAPKVRSVTLRAGGPVQQIDVPALAAVAVAVGGLGGDNVLVFETTAPGIIKFGDEEELGLTVGASRHACFSDTGCAPCPSGTTPRMLRVEATKAFVGAASIEGGKLSMQLVTHDDLCGITPPPTTVPGACHVGRWVSTRFLGPPVPDETSRSGGDGVVMELTGSGTVTLTFDGMNPYVTEYEGPDHGELIRNELVFSGGGRSTYAVEGGVMTGAAMDLTRIRIKVTVTVPGAPPITAIDKSLAELSGALGGDPGAGASIGGSNVSCSGDVLTLTRSAPGVGDVGWEFRRT